MWSDARWSTSRLTPLFGVALLVLLTAVPARAQRTDVVEMKNGDRVTCDVKGLQFGNLEVETESLGTLSIVWLDVATVTSRHRFIVTTAAGVEHAGTLEPVPAGGLVVRASAAEASPTLPIADIVQIRTGRDSFLQRVDGSLDAGFNFARANRQRQWTLSGTAYYSGLRWFHVGNVSSMFSSQEDTDSTSRNTVSLESGRMISRRAFYASMLLFQQNEELGLQKRLAGGGGIGRQLVSSNRRAMSIAGLLIVNHERFEGVASQTNLEAASVFRFTGFRRQRPRLDTTLTGSAIPSLTDIGRVRAEMNLSVSVELLHNFFAGFTSYDSFDSRPPNDQLTKNDYGFTTSLRWKF